MPTWIDWWASRARVAWGLGPIGPAQGPSGRSRATMQEVTRADGTSFAVELRVPTGPVRGALVVTPGIHFRGVADPRRVRFAEVMAAAGLVVCSPELQDHVALVPSARAVSDLGAAFDWFLQRPELPAGCRPGVWSVSFGVYAALGAAASPGRRDRVGGLFLFGPYDKPGRVLAHACDDGAEARDPLVRPLAYLWLLDELVDDAPARRVLADALRDYVRGTWTRDEAKRRAVREEVSTRIAASLDPVLRPLFRDATLGTGPDARVASAWARAQDRLSFLDPRPLLPGLRAPVTVAHGRTDPTIPFTEGVALAEAASAFVPAEALVTGFYGHTSGGARPGPGALWQELRTLARVVDRLVAVGTRGVG